MLAPEIQEEILYASSVGARVALTLWELLVLHPRQLGSSSERRGTAAPPSVVARQRKPAHGMMRP